MAAPSVAEAVAGGTHVSVTLAHVGALPATVESADEAALVLVLAVNDRRVRRLAGTQAAVDVLSGRGILRFLGTLEPDPRCAERVRVVLNGAAERIQRRGWARVEAVVPVRIRATGEPIEGQTSTLNVSGGGILVVDPWRMPLGTDVRIALQAGSGDDPIRALGRVVREGSSGQKGLHIVDIARDAEERLVRFVRERELAALRLARGRG